VASSYLGCLEKRVPFGGAFISVELLGGLCCLLIRFISLINLRTLNRPISMPSSLIESMMLRLPTTLWL
jgi:hypothetical protein